MPGEIRRYRGEKKRRKGSGKGVWGEGQEGRHEQDGANKDGGEETRREKKPAR